MTLKLRVVYIKASKKNSCFITEEQLHKLQLDAKKQLTLKAGNLKIQIHLVPYKAIRASAQHKIKFSEDLRDILLLPDDFSLQLRSFENNHVELGPIIGIFINECRVDSILKAKPGSVFHHFVKASSMLHALACFFSLKDIKLEEHTVNGIVWDKNKWVVKKLPLPEVIYDRCVGTAGRQQSCQLRTLLKGFKIFNSFIKLKKWQTFAALNKNPYLKTYLPETVVYKDDQKLSAAVDKYGSVYLKPNCLSKGKGVFKLSRYLDDKYLLEYRDLDCNKKIPLQQLCEIKPFLRQYLESGEFYIFQQAIPLARYLGKPFDMRLLYQKNWLGQWQLSGIVARIAASGSIITSPRSGGSVKKLSIVFKELYNEDLNRNQGLFKKLNDVGLAIAKNIETQFGDCFEVGLDMAIDINKNIRLIEANGKPLKVSLKRLQDTDIVRAIYQRPIEYAAYLTGFNVFDTCKQVLKLKEN